MRAFVSSLMRGDLMDARQAVVDAIDRVPYLSAWAFEFTPASPESADTAYLRHVREADIVIWLAGAEVTAPVIAEVDEALAHQRTLVVIRFGTDPQTPECKQLFDRVKAHAKYGEAADASEIPQALELAIGDIISRALRDKPSLGRLPLIETLGRASRARCVVRWQTPGLSRAEAVLLADDPSIGAGPPSVLPGGANRVVVLSGEMGAGKSLCAERHLQSAITGLLEDGNAPIPIWLPSKIARSGLMAAAMGVCQGVGEPRLQGATIVIDGLDEVGSDVGEVLLDEARELAHTWPDTTVLLTTRPLSSFRGVEELCPMPRLDDDAAWAIAERIAGRELPTALRYGLPPPVRQSIHRPLFALLYGIWQRQRRHEPRSQGDLLAFFGEQAEKRAGRDMREVLMRLSIASIRNELGPVPAAKVGSSDEVRRLLDSGVAAERTGQIEPGLPVLAQWFAGQALLEERVTISELLTEPDDIDLWRYPLALAIATGTFAQATKLLRPLMEKVPGFAFVVIDEALARASLEGVEAPSWEQAGQQMRQTLESVAVGIAPLHRVVLPVDGDGSLLPLGVSSGGEHVSYAFWHGDDPRPAVFPLTKDDFSRNDFAFPQWGSSAVGRGDAWAWRWTRDQLQRELEGVLKARAFDLSDCKPWVAEQTWAAAVSLADVPDLVIDRLEIAPLRVKLVDIIRDAESYGARMASFQRGRRSAFDAYWLDAQLKQRVSAGQTELWSPLPRSDLKPEVGIVGLFFSDERLIELATATYNNALEIYQHLVARWFGQLGERLCLSATLPARYVGRILINRNRDGNPHSYGIPQIEGHFEALEVGAQSLATFEMATERSSLEEGRAQYDRLRRMRPQAARWITSWSGGSNFKVGDIEAASKLAYNWLSRDLARLRIVGGSTPFI